MEQQGTTEKWPARLRLSKKRKFKEAAFQDLPTCAEQAASEPLFFNGSNQAGKMLNNSNSNSNLQSKKIAANYCRAQSSESYLFGLPNSDNYDEKRMISRVISCRLLQYSLQNPEIKNHPKSTSSLEACIYICNAVDAKWTMNKKILTRDS
jgi:hypothetical protein